MRRQRGLVIYHGKPTYGEEVALFKQVCKNLGLTLPIEEVDDKGFRPEQWGADVVLLVPGALSSELDVHLGEKVPAIRTFVERGGRFLGWCGGSFWRPMHRRKGFQR